MLDVCCVVVTYGDRFHFLEMVIACLMEQGVARVVVVNNGASEKTRTGLERLEYEFVGRLVVTTLPCNQGSAKGYKAGLSEAMRLGKDGFLYLLDDDNLPEDGALKALLEAWGRLSESEMATTALLSLRNKREQFMRIANGEPVERCFDMESSVLGFSVSSFISKVAQRMEIGQVVRREPLGLVAIPFAPYGGLLMRRDLVDKIGRPNEEYYLYHDDSEFTHRITRGGGKIYLVPDSEVTDLEDSWDKSSNKRLTHISYITDGSDARVYYAVRNKVNFYFRYFTNNKFIFQVNKCICLSIIALAAVVNRKWKRYSLIRVAIQDGESGKLGKNDNFEL